jgi:hypothetical protein
MFDNAQIPLPPKQSPLGWPLPDRREEFKKLLEEPPKSTHRIGDFKGTMITLPILRVPINVMKYRISNGRTASAQQEWVANKHLSDEYFDNGDPELEEIQLAQHQILVSMIKDQGLLAKFEDAKNKQVEPVLVDENGFIVNGNRRVCCWRELYRSDPDKYNHFSHVDIVVLPHCNEKELDRLEAKLQIEKDIRSDYSWHSEANMMVKKQRLHGFDTTELAAAYSKTEREIRDILAMRELAADYLRSRGKENAWSEVKEDKYAFQKLLEAQNATQAFGDREIIKQASYALIDDPAGTGERLYTAIPKVKEYLPAVKQGLLEAFPIAVKTTDAVAVAAFGGSTGTPKTSEASDLALVAEIKKDESSIALARTIVVDVVRSQDDQVKERAAADFLFKALRKANNSLQNAAGHGLRPESSLTGVDAQLTAIKAAVERIEKWLAEKKA